MTHTSTMIGDITNEHGDWAEEDQDKCRMMAEVSFPAPNPYDGIEYSPSHLCMAHTLVIPELVHGALFQQSNQKALGRDSLGIPIIKSLMDWDPERIIALVRQCLYLGYHPLDWKIANRVCIPKPGKKSYD
jgi:hypothetical protein